MLVSFLLYLSNMLYLLLSKTLIIIKLNLTTMTITKKQWMMLLLGAGVLFLVYWFFFRKKNTESSYDENLMIFGNENGYTNDELVDGGMGESAYGPMYGAIGSYGDETNWKLPWWIKAPFQPGGLEGGSFNPIGYRPIKPPFGPPKPIPTFPEDRDESNWKLPWWVTSTTRRI